MRHRKKGIMFLVIFAVFIISFFLVQSNERVLAKDIRLTAKSLNIKNARPKT